ncbi:alpha-L-fucosidase-like isoform X1 [Tubulanus polymorphus]|uniref:alpha-L-fucosidase-like isoform X1 n=1 Tax=Tubulanus polymorphus TaxID=672921 RepID=UPI003DA377A9
MTLKMAAVLIIIAIFGLGLVNCGFSPNWASLDSRPLPAWYDESKFGIFIHWGAFSVPSYGAPEAAFFWNLWRNHNKAIVDFAKANYPPNFTYADFASQFKAELFNPDEWAEIIEASGARYVVLTSKHHEGFINWGGKYSWNWNAVDTGPHRDLVGDLANSIRKKTKVHFGLYYSLFEWFHPLWLQDKANNFATRDFVTNKMMPEIHELINTFKPEVLWSDGDWEASWKYWNSTGFLAWLYNESPVKDYVVTNDRWGSDARCKHGGFYDCNDKYDPGVLQKHKWENCMTIDRGSWGYRRNSQLSDYLTMDEITQTLAETVSCGGNLLMNIGPTHDGRIMPIFEERLRQMGDWLKVNGEAIYASKPWIHQNDTVTKGVWYTSQKTVNGTAAYAIVLDWPKGDLFLGAPVPTTRTTVTMLGVAKPFKWLPGPKGGITIHIPPMSPYDMPCQWAWVFKLEYLAFH